MQLADRWLDGDMDWTTKQLSPELVHPALRTLIAGMAIQENEDFARRHPGEFNCRIEIKDRSGNVFAAQTAHPKGHRSNPLTDSEVEDKFRGLASGFLPMANAAGRWKSPGPWTACPVWTSFLTAWWYEVMSPIQLVTVHVYTSGGTGRQGCEES